jgi:frataxin-like iron-binding protein CyaY
VVLVVVGLVSVLTVFQNSSSSIETQFKPSYILWAHFYNQTTCSFEKQLYAPIKLNLSDYRISQMNLDCNAKSVRFAVLPNSTISNFNKIISKLQNLDVFKYISCNPEPNWCKSNLYLYEMPPVSKYYVGITDHNSKLPKLHVGNITLKWKNGQLVDNIPYSYPYSISCVNSHYCVAVSEDGYVFTYKNSKWLPRHQINENEFSPLYSVSCPTVNFCATVGAHEDVYLFQNNKWSSPIALGESNIILGSVSCTSDKFCMVLATNGDAFTYLNGTWSQGQKIDSTVSDDFESVSCSINYFCLAGFLDGFVYAYNNGKWSSGTQVDNYQFQSGAGMPIIYSISCYSPDFCFASGYPDTVYRYLNNSWSSGTQLGNPVITTNIDPPFPDPIESISCPTMNFCLAISLSGHAFIYNNGKWGQEEIIKNSQKFGGFDSVSCPSDTFCMAVSSGGYVYTLSK